MPVENIDPGESASSNGVDGLDAMVLELHRS
jgi:hypothetical protein